MLNENIKALRKSKGLSQQDLADKLNVVRQTISKWEQGLSVPDSDLLIALSVSQIPQFARIVRSSVLSVKDAEYIEAARAVGASDVHIILRYIVPNALSPVIVQGTLGVATTILNVAGLSFLGLGVEPPAPEWGSILSSARMYMREAWHISLFPGIAIVLCILSLNLLGDGLRDALDPKQKR